MSELKKKKCEECNGTGIEEGGTTDDRCAFCNGTGFYLCPFCVGHGFTVTHPQPCEGWEGKTCTCSGEQVQCICQAPDPMGEFKTQGPFGLEICKEGGYQVVGPYGLDADFNPTWVNMVSHEELVKNIANELNEAWSRRTT